MMLTSDRPPVTWSEQMDRPTPVIYTATKDLSRFRQITALSCSMRTHGSFRLSYDNRTMNSSLLPNVTLPSVKMFQFNTALLTLMFLLAMPVLATGYVLESSSDVMEMGSSSLSVTCYRHFGHRVQSCVEPFTSLLTLYDDNVERLRHPLEVAKHICLEYQMVLLCLHSALTDCPTLKNLKRVQSTLDSHWVARMNELCSIPSTGSTQKETSEYEDLTNYLFKRTSQNSPDSYRIAEDILRVSLKTTSEIEKEILSSSSQDIYSDRLLASKHRLSPSLQKEMDYLEFKQREKSDVQTSDVQLNIFNFMGDYNNFDGNNKRRPELVQDDEKDYVTYERHYSAASYPKFSRLSLVFALAFSTFWFQLWMNS